jgi:hypothetical protein
MRAGIPVQNYAHARLKNRDSPVKEKNGGEDRFEAGVMVSCKWSKWCHAKTTWTTCMTPLGPLMQVVMQVVQVVPLGPLA